MEREPDQALAIGIQGRLFPPLENIFLFINNVQGVPDHAPEGFPLLPGIGLDRFVLILREHDIRPFHGPSVYVYKYVYMIIRIG
jgi:hypothetical protein